MIMHVTYPHSSHIQDDLASRDDDSGTTDWDALGVSVINPARGHSQHSHHSQRSDVGQHSDGQIQARRVIWDHGGGGGEEEVEEEDHYQSLSHISGSDIDVEGSAPNESNQLSDRGSADRGVLAASPDSTDSEVDGDSALQMVLRSGAKK